MGVHGQQTQRRLGGSSYSNTKLQRLQLLGRALVQPFATLLLLIHFSPIGESNGRFLAARRQPDPDRKDCFFSSLSIAKVVSGDSGVYFFTAKNERGQLRFGIKLQIVDPITMTTLVGIAGAALLFIVALACFMAFTLKNRKEAKSVCCAKKKGDSESETSFYPYVTATSPSRRQQVIQKYYSS